jgi:4-carboxymuconolactone decarboxylase
MPAIAAADLTDEQRRAAEEFRSGRGYAVHGPFAVMLRSPEVMLRAKAMGDYLRFRNVLPKRVSEMVILIAAREWTQQFEWHHHYRHAMEAGLAEAVADVIADGRRPDALAEDEAAAYDFSMELHRRKSVSDATYTRALALFGERGIIDLIGLSGYYSFLAMMMNVARMPVDPEPLQRFPN